MDDKPPQSLIKTSDSQLNFPNVLACHAIEHFFPFSIRQKTRLSNFKITQS